MMAANTQPITAAGDQPIDDLITQDREPVVINLGLPVHGIDFAASFFANEARKYANTPRVTDIPKPPTPKRDPGPVEGVSEMKARRRKLRKKAKR